MIFSDLYKSPRSPLSKIRHSFPHAVPPPSDIDADLVSRDKARQKEAVKRYLTEKVRNDWAFVWPPVRASAPSPAPAEPATASHDEPRRANEDKAPDAAPLPASTAEEGSRDAGEEADSESDAESVYSTISEDPVHFRTRAEWISDLSDNDEPHAPVSPFRFDGPEAVGTAVHHSIETGRERRRRAVREEVKWNPGLACFEARRDAWTGARTVRVKPKPPSPVSPSSPRRLFWRHHRTESSASHNAAGSPLQPTTTRTSQLTDATTASSESDCGKSTAGAQQRPTSPDSAPQQHVPYPVQTVLPIPPPLLPPQNPMRASVQPSMYGALYDKVVVQSLQPSCPVNLSDMVRACVAGWKRDGEWPPKSAYPAVHLPAVHPPVVQTPPVEVLAMRQRKAQQQQQQQQQQQRRQSGGSAGAPGGGSHSRRLSFVGFLSGGGSGGGGNKGAAAEKTATHEVTAAAAAGKAGKDGKETARSQSHSDEGSRTLFRRSLQKVLSLGHQHQHQHQHGQGHGHGHDCPVGNANGNGDGASVVPHTPVTPPPTKEVAAAG